MKHSDDRLVTPLYVKTDGELPWPTNDRAFYVLSANGLFLCRDHPFFRSSVPARHWPSELAKHRKFLELRHPKVPRRQVELIVGFFSKIAELHNAEAAALLLWDRAARRVKVHIPRQQATVFESWTGRRSPQDVSYDVPDLPQTVSVIGDAHSHVDGPAYSSAKDKRDEAHRAGLHVVVGRISREPPEFHCEFVVDSARFEVDPPAVMGTYRRRRTEIPEEWLDRVEVKVERPMRRLRYYGAASDRDPKSPSDLTPWERQ